MGKVKRNNLAVSEVLDTVLLLGIAVALFSVLSFIVLTYPFEPSTPSVNIVGYIDGDDIVLEHLGGESLDLDTRVLITIGIDKVTFNARDLLDDEFEDDNLWGLGEILNYTSNDIPGKQVTITVVDINSNSVVMMGTLQEGISTPPALNINIIGQGSVARDIDPPYTYGTVVTLTANEEPGWIFDHWAGDLNGNTNPDTIIVDSTKTVTAVFLELFTLDVDVLPMGQGTVTLDPSGGVYADGTSVEITAEGIPGWAFSYWSGDVPTGSENDNPLTIVMDSNKSLTANFAEGQYTLTINVVGSGSVTKIPDEPTYAYNAVVTLTPAADSDWNFNGWSGPDAGDLVDNLDGTWDITMNDDKSITATFTPMGGSITVIKDAIPNDPQIFSFTGDLGAFTLVDNGGTNSQTFTDLDAGTYIVTETVSSGWYLTDINIVDPSSDSSYTLPSATTLLDDGFEGTTSTWDDNWDSISHNWYRSPTRRSGSYSAGSSNDNEGAFTCDDLDTSDASSITIDFWYRSSNTEPSDLTLSYYDGSSYNDITDLGSNTYGIFLHYTDTITDSQYFISNFKIRFTSNLGNSENVWVDDVLITKEVSGKAIIVLSEGEDVTVTFTNKLPQTVILRPNAGGSTTQLSRNTGSSNWACVDEVTSDGDTTYVMDPDSGNWDTDTYGTENSADLGTISSVTVYSKCKRHDAGSSSASYSRTALRVDGTIYSGDSNDMGTSYTDYSTTYETNPGGGSWTWTDINNLQCGVSLYSGDTSGGSQSHARCTQVWVEVTYMPS